MNKLEKQYKRLDISIKCLKWFLILLMLVFTCVELSKYTLCTFPFSRSCLANFLSEVIEITKVIIPLLATLLATLIADRYITDSILSRTNEQIFEVVQISHRYIAIANDLQSKVEYFKEMFTEGGHAITDFVFITDSIQNRYESLFEKEAYKYLSGDTVDTINSMSGSICGIMSTTLHMKEKLKGNLVTVSATKTEPPVAKLLEEIKKLKNDLYMLRKSVESD